jgi:hypothetical protein
MCIGVAHLVGEEFGWGVCSREPICMHARILQTSDKLWKFAESIYSYFSLLGDESGSLTVTYWIRACPGSAYLECLVESIQLKIKEILCLAASFKVGFVD